MNLTIAIRKLLSDKPLFNNAVPSQYTSTDLHSCSTKYAIESALKYATNRIQYGIGVPKGAVAYNQQEAESVAKSIGMFGVQDLLHAKANCYRWR
jgi:hypothetical protein